MKVAKIRAVQKSRLASRRPKDVLKEKLVHAVLELHHSDPYVNATPAKKIATVVRAWRLRRSKAKLAQNEKTRSLVVFANAQQVLVQRNRRYRKLKRKRRLPRDKKRVAKEAKVDETKTIITINQEVLENFEGARKVDETKLSRRSTRREH